MNEEIPAWCRAPEQRYGLLCLARGAYYIKDRRRSWRLQTGQVRPTKLEREWGGWCGFGLRGRRFRSHEEAETARQHLIARAYLGMDES